jgi:hypothetical protein
MNATGIDLQISKVPVGTQNNILLLGFENQRVFRKNGRLAVADAES